MIDYIKIQNLTTSSEMKKRLMSKLACKDYGFECDFEVSSLDAKDYIKEFQAHTLKMHYIDYSDGALLQLMTQKENRIF